MNTKKKPEKLSFFRRFLRALIGWILEYNTLEKEHIQIIPPQNDEFLKNKSTLNEKDVGDISNKKKIPKKIKLGNQLEKDVLTDSQLSLPKRKSNLKKTSKNKNILSPQKPPAAKVNRKIPEEDNSRVTLYQTPIIRKASTSDFDLGSKKAPKKIKKAPGTKPKKAAGKLKTGSDSKMQDSDISIKRISKVNLQKLNRASLEPSLSSNSSHTQAKTDKSGDKPIKKKPQGSGPRKQGGGIRKQSSFIDQKSTRIIKRSKSKQSLLEMGEKQSSFIKPRFSETLRPDTLSVFYAKESPYMVAVNVDQPVAVSFNKSKSQLEDGLNVTTLTLLKVGYNMLAQILLFTAIFVGIYWIYYTPNNLSLEENATKLIQAHGLLMMTGFVFLVGQSMIVFRSCFCFSFLPQKLAHTILVGIASVCIVSGTKAGMDARHHLAEPFLYHTLHSWLGIAALVVFSLQMFSSLLYFFILNDFSSGVVRWNGNVINLHIIAGRILFILGIGTCLTGMVIGGKRIFSNLDKDGLLIQNRVHLHYLGTALIGICVLIPSIILVPILKPKSIFQ